MLYCVTCSCFFCSTEKVGYELPASGDYIFYVSWRRNPWRDAFLIKKCF